MHLKDHLSLLLLAALWGASFLFLRQAAPVVGPVIVATVRTLGGALVLLPLLMLRQSAPRPLSVLKQQGWTLAGVALTSTLLPFLFLSQAALSLSAGLMSILNASTPLWGAAIGWVWTREPLGRRRLLGLATGFAGVVLLSAERLHRGHASGLAILFVLLATFCYALSVHTIQRKLHGVPSLTITTLTLGITGMALLLPACLGGLPATAGAGHDLSLTVWIALGGLAVLCTGFAYDLFNRLIARVGASRAISVTFLIPVFGMLWGTLFLGETVSASMLLGTAVILAGTLLSNQGAVPVSRTARPIHFEEETR